MSAEGPNDDAPSGSSELRWATSEDWEKHQAEIISLYRDSNRTLKEVVEYMEAHYQFRATLRMYKRRLSRWKVEKNINENDALAVVQSEEYKSADANKPAVVNVNGRDIRVAKVELYFERRRRQTEALQKRGSGSGTLRTGFTPPPRVPLSGPNILQVPEDIGRLIQKYIDGSFESGSWIVGSHRDELTSSNSKGSLIDIFNILFKGCGLIRQNDIKAGFENINKSLDTIGQTLTEEDPRFLGSLLRLLALCHWYGLEEIYSVLLTHLHQLSGILLGSGHPATRVFTLLKSIPRSDREVGLKIAAELHCRHLQNYVSQKNSGAFLNLTMNYVDTLENLGLYDESTQQIVETVRFPDANFQWSRESLRLYFYLIRRATSEKPSGPGDQPFPPANYVDPLNSLEVFAPVLEPATIPVDSATAEKIMSHCYTLRVESLRKGRHSTTVTKGGPNMWPSLWTCEDGERIKILKELLLWTDEDQAKLGAWKPFCRKSWHEFCQRQPVESFTGVIPAIVCGAPEGQKFIVTRDDYIRSELLVSGPAVPE